MQTYDLIVTGSGPAGQRAAIQGAKSGKRVAVVERREVIGGTCTATIPSKTMREAGVRVILVEKRPRLLEFADSEMVV